MHRRFAFVTTLAIALVVGCGGDSASPTQTVAGRWSYTATNVNGGGVSCNFTGVTLTLAQSGSTVTGSTVGGNVSCTAPGVPPLTESLSGDVIANGKVTGNAVQFDIGTSEIHNDGTLSGNAMSGTLTLRVATGTTTINLIGNFSALRQ
jgi:hypothetical protein